MTIGIPRAMLYYRYGVLWETFFKELNCDVVVSGETNKRFLENGIKYSIDECCLPSKIYLGHVFSLIGKCDYILVPRVSSYGRKDDVCVKFNALYDIVKNTFKGVNLLDYNIDRKRRGQNELTGFLRMGKKLGLGYLKAYFAYKKAKRAQRTHDELLKKRQEEILKETNTVKILIVSHPYNIYDKMIGYPIVKLIKKEGGQPVFADRVDKKEAVREAKKMSRSLYWRYNKELIGSLNLLKGKIDGIVLLTAFPCGPDSLVNELILRKYKRVPAVNIILDELQGEAGLQTRIESFMDIIKERKAEKRTA